MTVVTASMGVAQPVRRGRRKYGHCNRLDRIWNDHIFINRLVIGGCTERKIEMNEENAVIKIDETMRLGSLAVANHEAVITTATSIAKSLADIVNSRKLFSVISGRKFVRVEGWSTMGAMLGVLPREKEVAELENGDFLAVVELIRSSDGAVVGQGSAIVGGDEPTWNKRPRYARRSMALTRATGKAFRLGFSWIISLAGYETTPAEEMEGVIDGQVVEHSSVPVEHDAPAPIHSKTVQFDPSIQPVTKDMGLEAAEATTTKNGKPYKELTNDELEWHFRGCNKELRLKRDVPLTDEKRVELELKRDAAATVYISRQNKAT
jgi:hypothetical protein